MLVLQTVAGSGSLQSGRLGQLSSTWRVVYVAHESFLIQYISTAKTTADSTAGLDNHCLPRLRETMSIPSSSFLPLQAGSDITYCISYQFRVPVHVK